MKTLKITLSIVFVVLIGITAQAQIKVGDNPLTIDDGSILELESTSRAFVLPRMTTGQRDLITTPLKSAMIFNTTENCIQINIGTPQAPDWQCLTYDGTDEDNQIITDFVFDEGTQNLNITLEDGNTAVVNLSYLDNQGTDDQALSINGNILTLEDGGTVDLSPYLDNTDDQLITAFSFDQNTFELLITLENGGTKTVDLTFLTDAGSDDQQIEDFTLSGNILNLQLEDGGSESVDLSQYLDDTDNQTITDFSITNDVLTITLEDGNSKTIDLTPYLDNTDNQQLESATLDGTTLTISLENGGSKTVDLSAFDNAGTDDQQITDFFYDSVNNVVTITLEDGGTKTMSLAGLDDVGTDDQQITQFDIATNILTVALEDGGTANVDLTPYLDNTDDQTITDFSYDSVNNVVSITLEDGNTMTLSLAGLDDVGTDDQQLQTFSVDGTVLTISLEDGGSKTVDLAAFDNAGTDDQQITDFSFDGVNNVITITLEDGGTKTLSLAGLDDVGTDDQQITQFDIATNILTVALEDGGTANVDLTPYLDNTDDQEITDFSYDDVNNVVSITLEDGNTMTLSLAGLDDVGTDDQQLQTFSVDGTVLTISLEDGGSKTVDLAAFDNAGTDDQQITDFSFDGVNNVITITLEDGGTKTLSLAGLDDVGTDDQQLTITGDDLNLEDGGTVDLSKYLDNTDDQQITTFAYDPANNNITLTLEDGGTETISLADLNDAGSDDQQITQFDIASNTLTITLEDGGTQNVDLSPYLDNTDDQQLQTFSVDGTILTISLEDGGSKTVDLAAFDNAGTDDQQITDFSFDSVNNVVTITLEDGGTQTLSLAGLDNVGTDDQQLTINGNDLTLEDGGTVDLTPYLDNTDDQQITTFAYDPSNNNITLTLEDGGSETISLSDLNDAGSDDQQITQFDIVSNTLTVTLEDGGTANVDLTPYLDNTDDQQLQTFSVDGTILTISLEDGGSKTVDLAVFDNSGSDDQQITTFDYDETTDIVTITLEDGGTKTISLAGLDDAGTDDQTLTINGNDLTLEDGGIVDLTPYLDNTDDQQITIFDFDANSNVVTITLEDGGTKTIDLTGLNDAGSDDQQITQFDIIANTLTVTLEDGGTANVDLAPYLDNTDDQTITLTGDDLILEDGGTVDLSKYLDNTDDQQLQTFSVDGTILTISLEDGGSKTVDLAIFDNAGTDDQQITTFDYDEATDIVTITLEDGGTKTINLSDLDDAGTDDQTLTINGNDLTLEDGGIVDLTPYLDNTDDQLITTFDFDATTNVVTITLEDGGTKTIDLTGLNDAGSDDQQITQFDIVANQLTVTLEDGGTANVDLTPYLDNTDDQTISLDASNILTLEDGGNVNLTPYLDNTDDQQIQDFSIDGTVLTLVLEDGGTKTVDIVQFDDPGTDDQVIMDFSFDPSTNNISITLEDGGTKTISLSDLDDSGTDDQALETFSVDGTILTISLEDGGSKTVDLAIFDNSGTDDQQITTFDYDEATDIVTITLEDGGTKTINLSDLDDAGTDDQTLTINGNDLTLEDGGIVDLTPYLDNTDDQLITTFDFDATTNVVTITLEDGGTKTIDLTGLNDAGSDDQLITQFDIVANTLTVTLEDGGTANVDLTPYLDNTDDQAISLDASNILTLEDGGNVNLTPYLDNTDDQQLQTFSVDGTILTISLEDGGSKTVDLAAFDNAGTDDQQITDFFFDTVTNLVTITLEDGGTKTLDLAGLDDVGTDDQTLTINGNDLTLEDGGIVDLTPYLDNTDDQLITTFDFDASTNVVTITLEDGGTKTIDLTGLNDAGSDDQQITQFDIVANQLTVTLEDGGTANVDLTPYLDNTDDQAISLDASNILTLEDGGNVNLTPYLDNTDDQQLQTFSVDGTILTISLEDGGSKTVDLAIFDNSGTDDQQITDFFFDTATNLVTITLEDGGTKTLDLAGLDDVGTDDQTLTINGNDLTLEDGGIVDLTPYLDNTDDQLITTFDFDASTNVVTITLEDGGTKTIDLTGLNDAGSDDQQITQFDIVANQLTVTLEDGGTANVDLTPYLDNTDDQAISLDASNILALEDGGNVNLTPYLDNTDDQQLQTFSVDGTILTISLEDGGSKTVDLAAFDNAGTDDQQITDFFFDTATNLVTITLEDGGTKTLDLAGLDDVGTDDQTLTINGNDLTLEDGGIVDLTPYLDNTDDQLITTFDFDASTNVVTITLEDGGTKTIDLTGLNDAGSDDQQITQFDIVANQLTVTLEDGGTANVDLTPYLDNTDDQAISLDASNILTLEDGGNVNLTPYLDNTDDQQLQTFSVDGTILTISLEDGGSKTVDLAAFDNAGTDDQQITDFFFDTATNLVTITLEDGGTKTLDLAGLDDVGTDDQTLTINGNDLTLEDGGIVDLTPYLDNTDDQLITTFDFDASTNVVTITLEDGGTKTIDLTGLNDAGSDDQQITQFDIVANQLTVTLEDGGTANVDLTPYLDNTDDQAISLDASNILTLEDGGNVNLTPYLDNTDDQQLQTFSVDGTILTISLEDGGSKTVDLAIFDNSGTDDQQITDFFFDTATNLVTITLEDGGTKTLDLAGLDDVGTDDQTLTINGNDLTLEDGGIVDLTPYLDNTDDQLITTFDFDASTNVVTITLEDGGTKTIDLTGLNDAGSDDQQITQFDIVANQLTVTLEDGGTANVDLTPYLDNTDDQAISLDASNILTLEDGGNVNLTPYLDNTDDQQITNFAIDGDILTIALEDGGSWTVDLSGYDNAGTDDQQISLDASNILTLEDGGTIDLTPYLDNTDDQQLESLSIDGTILTISLEDGGSKTVDLAAFDNAGTDDQNLTSATLDANNILTIAIEDGNPVTVDLSQYVDTDEQQITAFSFDDNTGDLTITLERGGTQTINLGSLFENIYTVDGTLEGNRTVNMDGKWLSFSGTDDVVIHPDGKMSIGKTSVNPAVELEVDGDILAIQVHASSDARFKKDVSTITDALNKVNQMRGVAYNFDQAAFPDRNFPTEKQVGFIAQEIEKVLPEVVMTDNQGFKAVDYSKVTALLTEAVKEQQKQIELLSQKLMKSESTNAGMMAELASIKEMILSIQQAKAQVLTTDED